MTSGKLNKKLVLKKVTVAGLCTEEQRLVKGGYYFTEIGGDCYTWHPVCFTLPAYKCIRTIPEICA